MKSQAITILFEEWCCMKSKKSPKFKYWYQVLLLKIDVLLFIQSLRDSDIALYKDSLDNLTPWFFAFDHTNYARFDGQFTFKMIISMLGGYLLWHCCITK